MVGALEDLVILNGSIKHFLTAIFLPGVFLNNFQDYLVEHRGIF